MIGNEDQDKKKNIKEKESVQEYKTFSYIVYIILAWFNQVLFLFVAEFLLYRSKKFSYIYKHKITFLICEDRDHIH